MSAAVEELYTVVKNPNATARTYGFLGPRGMRLAPGEAVAIPGDLVASLGFLHQQGGRRRKFDAFERCLRDERLIVQSRPAPILYDTAQDKSYAVAVHAGVLGIVDPNYTEPDGSSLSLQG